MFSNVILNFIVFGVIVPYLLGSISFSIIVTKLLYKKDIRTFGSGNAGMTNVLRTFGKGAALLTIIGDIGKGVLAVNLCRLSMNMAGEQFIIIGLYVSALFAVLGHIYPVYFGFKGGKAVSVGVGSVIGINPILALPLVIVFFIVFAISKMVSLASICGGISYPISTFVYYQFILKSDATLLATACSLVIAGLVVWMHRSNIKRIANGTEYKFLQKKK